MATNQVAVRLDLDSGPVLEANRSLVQMGQTADASRGQVAQIGASFGAVATTAEEGVGRVDQSVHMLGQSLDAVGTSLKAIDDGLKASLVGVARGVDLVARGITDIRVIGSVFERDVNEPVKTTGERFADTARHAIELQVATSGLRYAGLETAASLVTVAARASLAAGAVYVLGTGLYEAAGKARAFEAESKSLEAALRFTNDASGITSGTATALIDQANRTTGFDRGQLTSTMAGLIKARTLGPGDLESTFSLGTAFADRSGQDAGRVVQALTSSYNDLGSAAKTLENVGINLTAAQRKQVDAFAESGDRAKGYAVILEEVAARNQEYADKVDSSAQSSRRFSAELAELERNIGQGWRNLVSLFEVDLTKLIVDPVRNALSDVLGLINQSINPSVGTLEARLQSARSSLAEAEKAMDGADVLSLGARSQDVAVRRRDVEDLTAALDRARNADAALRAQQGRQRQEDVMAYEQSKNQKPGKEEGPSDLDRALEALAKRREHLAYAVSDLAGISGGARESAAAELEARQAAEARVAVQDTLTLARQKYDDAVAKGDAEGIASARKVIEDLGEIEQAFKALTALRDGFNRDTAVSRQIMADRSALEMANAEVQALGRNRAEREQILALTRLQIEAKARGGSDIEVNEEISRRAPIAQQTAAAKAYAEDWREAEQQRKHMAKSATDEIVHSSARMFEDMLSGHKSGWRGFFDDLVSYGTKAFAKLAAEAIIRPVVEPMVTSAVNSIMGGGTSAPTTINLVQGSNGQWTIPSGGGGASGLSGLLGGGSSLGGGSGGGWLSDIKSWFNTPIGGSGPLTPDNVDAWSPDANYGQGILGGTTWGEGLGALGSMGMGLYSMAKGNYLGGAAGMIGGVASLAGFPMIGGLLGGIGSLFGGMFGGGGRGTPLAMADIGIKDGRFYLQGAGGDNGGDPSQYIAQANEMISQLNGIADKFNFKVKDGLAWHLGSGVWSDQDATSPQALMSKMLGARLFSSDDPIYNTILAHSSATTLQGLASDLDFKKQYQLYGAQDKWTKTLFQVDDTYTQLIKKASDLGLATDDLTAAFKRQHEAQDIDRGAATEALNIRAASASAIMNRGDTYAIALRTQKMQQQLEQASALENGADYRKLLTEVQQQETAALAYQQKKAVTDFGKSLEIAILSVDSPLQSRLVQLEEETQNARLQAASMGITDLAQVEEAGAAKRRKILEDAAKPLSSLLDSLATGGAGRTALERFDAQQSIFEREAAKARTSGDLSAAASAGQTLISMASSVYSSMSAQRSETEQSVLSTLRDVAHQLGLPGYATGTGNADAGWHWVGERGPELMRFRGGEQVLPFGSLPAPDFAPLMQGLDRIERAVLGVGTILMDRFGQLLARMDGMEREFRHGTMVAALNGR